MKTAHDLNDLYQDLKDWFGDLLKGEETEDWYVGKYLIVPQFGDWGFEEFVVYDTAVYDWEVIGNEPDDGEKEFIRCKYARTLYYMMC